MKLHERTILIDDETGQPMQASRKDICQLYPLCERRAMKNGIFCSHNHRDLERYTYFKDGQINISAKGIKYLAKIGQRLVDGKIINGN